MALVKSISSSKRPHFYILSFLLMPCWLRCSTIPLPSLGPTAVCCSSRIPPDLFAFVLLPAAVGGRHLPSESLVPSQTVLRLAVDKQSSIITQDLAAADLNIQAAETNVLQQLRSVIAIPLYTMPRASSAESAITLKRGDFLGIVYLDSRRPAAFSCN